MPKNASERVIDSSQRGGGLTFISGGGSVPGGGVSDHGQLAGLGDDDHTQYFNAARGDARYTLLATYTTHAANANAHHARLHDILGASDHSVTGGAALDVIGQSGAGVLARLTPSADVSAGASALLKSSGGGLTLRALAVNGDDFAVGTVFTVDASAANVGINCVPDPQFALDVNGPARAQYFIGPHAIQLKDVLLLAHFDGRQPFASNYFGEPNGHMGQVATPVGDLIYRPGMFGTKAAQCAPVTENLLPNPGAETNATGYATDRTGATVTQQAAAAYIGSYGIQRTAGTSGSQNLYYSGAGALTGSTAYTFSAHLRASDGSDISASGIVMYLDSSDGGQTPTAIVPVGDGWYRFILTRTVKGSPGNAIVGFGSLPAGIWYTDGWQLEQKGYATPYHSSALSVGTASATRVASGLTYPTAGNLNPNAGTIMAWVWVDGDTGGDQYIFRCTAASGTEHVILRRATGGQLVGYWGATARGTAATVPLRAWTHVAMTFDGTNLRLFVNGATNGAQSVGTKYASPSSIMYVGRNSSDTAHLNGYIDDLVITSSAMADAAVLAVVESAAPVFAESSRYSFRATPNSLVWADDEGWWIKAADGDPVLGVYAGSATKSWGGTSLAPGDLLIGKAANGMLWDDSETALIVSGASGSNAAGLVSPATIATTTTAFWAGAAYADRATAPFRVAYNGDITARWLYGSDNSQYGGGTGTKLSLRPAGGDASDFYLDLTTGTFAGANFKRPMFNLGYQLSTETADLALGWGRTGNGDCRIRMMTDATSGGGTLGTAYTAQINRAAGTNGVWSFAQTGTGEFQIASASSDIKLYTASTLRLTVGSTITAAAAMTASSTLTATGLLTANGGIVLAQDKGILFNEWQSGTTPAQPTQNTQIIMYMKNNKVVFQFYGGNPVDDYYLSFDMGATSPTWSYGTSAP